MAGELDVTEEQWTQLKPLIVQLYINEAKPLKEVISLIKQKHDFTTTPRMYKYRLNKWGLLKRNKESDIIQMWLLKNHRDATGRRSKFTVRGRDIEWQQVDKYLARRPDLERKLKSGMFRIQEPQLDIICRTPSPELVEPQSIPLLLNIPNDPEKILRVAIAFCNGSSEANFWTSHDAFPKNTLARQYEFSRVSDWNARLFTAYRLFALGIFRPAFDTVNSCLDMLKEMIRNPTVVLFFHFCDMALLPGEQLTGVLFKHTGQLARMVLGNQHPLYLFSHALASFPKEKFQNLLQVVMRAVVNTYEIKLGRHDLRSKLLLLHYYIWLKRAGLSIQEINALAVEPPSLDSVSADFIGVSYLGRLASALELTGEDNEAERILQLMEPWLDANRKDINWRYLQLGYYAIRGIIALKTNQHEATCLFARKIEELRGQGPLDTSSVMTLLAFPTAPDLSWPED